MISPGARSAAVCRHDARPRRPVADDVVEAAQPGRGIRDHLVGRLAHAGIERLAVEERQHLAALGVESVHRRHAVEPGGRDEREQFVHGGGPWSGRAVHDRSEHGVVGVPDAAGSAWNSPRVTLRRIDPRRVARAASVDSDA